ncbi:DUF2089 domain-containing protein [bacterium]|nr:DUF2089 domain-containing protein [bacterium]
MAGRTKQANRIGNCPVCGEELVITGLACEYCRTQLTGKFARCRFCSLSEEQVHFIEVFLDCRGNIREVERELNISYPTVRNRLEEVRQVLGFSGRTEMDREEVRRNILESLSRGEITPKEALKQIQSDKMK